ncbi:hypothetical protein V1523DRAFT_465091 [Lipomyces doorenjongii]
MFNTFRVSSSSSSGSSAEKPSKSASRNLFRSRLTATPSTATCSTARTDPSASPTPETARKRSYFNEDLKVKLMRHCVVHQGEYVRRRKGQFWKDIARVFEAETVQVYPLENPARLWKTFIKERGEQLRCRSGVAEADTELKQALDAFMQRFDDVEREEQDLLAKKEDMAEVKAKTKAIRRQMMLGRRRTDDDDGDAAAVAANVPKILVSRSRVRNGQALTEAISTGMQLLAGAIQPFPEEGPISFDRATELEVQVHDVDKKVSELSKQFFERISSMDEKLDRLFQKLEPLAAVHGLEAR